MSISINDKTAADATEGQRKVFFLNFLYNTLLIIHFFSSWLCTK